MIQTWKIGDSIVRAIKITLLLILILSCDKNEQKTFCYKITNNKGAITGYLKKDIYWHKNERIDSVYRYNKSKDRVDTYVEKYIYTPNGVKIKGNSDFLISIKDTCYKHLDFLNNKKETCFLGMKKITINNTDYNNIYAFRTKGLKIDGISKIDYYDKDYILIQSEFEKGFLHYFKISITKENIKGLK